MIDSRLEDAMHLVRLAVLVVIGMLAIACTGKSPAAPSGPTAATLVISGDDVVLTGSFSNYTATATLSDGTTRSVTPTWRSTFGISPSSWRSHRPAMT